MASSSNSRLGWFERLRSRRAADYDSSSPSPSPEPPDPFLEDLRPSRDRFRSSSVSQSYASFLASSNTSGEEPLIEFGPMSPETTPNGRTSFKRKALSSIRGESSSPPSRSHPSARRRPSMGNASSSAAARTGHRAQYARPGFLTYQDLDTSPTDDDSPTSLERRLDLSMAGQNPISLHGVAFTTDDVYDLVDKDTSRFQRLTSASAIVLVMPTSDPPNHTRYLALEGSGRRGYDLHAPESQLVGLNGPVNPPPVAVWPGTELPVEIFDYITQNLSRDDVKQMRLVCKDFEYKVSHNLFHTSVVPFNTELYDMIDETAKNGSRSAGALSFGPGKGKGKMRAIENSRATSGAPALSWQNAKNDQDGKMYRGHGLRVFQGFGPRIQRFGMSFEVQEDQLFNPPKKQDLDEIVSYHGSYNWPPVEYARFANIAGLERTADELSRMKAAFANLTNTKELALSLDNGLGWLTGSDKSIRARVFQRPSPIFGTEYQVPDEKQRMAEELWAALQRSHASLRANGESDFTRAHLAYRQVKKSINEIPGLANTVYDSPNLWPIVHQDSTPLVERRAEDSAPHLGVVFAVTDWGNVGLSRPTRNLSKEGKEWLLEMEWAQRAFLESYMLAVVDNRHTFGTNVTRLHIPKLSSFFIPTIARSQFWYALPSLQDVTLHVSPAWRTVDKDSAGCATLIPQSPSSAVDSFFNVILRGRLATHPHIKKLNIGWADGGEHAEGLFARNSHILPAPLIDVSQSLSGNPLSIIVLPKIEHLTLYNCWMTPTMLERFIVMHNPLALEKLTLDSVSLTADVNTVLPGAQAVQAAQAGQAGPAGPAGQMGQMGFFGQALQAQAAQVQAVQAQALHAQAANAPLQHMNPAHLHMAALMNAMGAAQANGVNWQALFAPNGLGQHNNGQFGGLALPNAAQGNIVQIPQPPFAAPVQAAAQNQAAAPAAPAGVPAALAALFAAAPPVAAQAGAAAPAQGQAPVSAPAPAVPTNGWSRNHRNGCWANVLDLVSPGPTLASYRPAPQPWEEPLPERSTNLKTLELKSCGYAKFLTPVAFDQAMFENGTDPRYIGPWWEKKRDHLSSSLMEERDRYMAIIVPEMQPRELHALQYAWGLVEGWSDAEKAAEATYDGHRPGGSGRITGTITHDMAPTLDVQDT